jgi:hypothetical protein
MERLRKLIKEALSTPPKKDSCNCGCHSCENVGNPGVVLNESVTKSVILTENLQYHVQNQLPLTENTFRYGSQSFLDLWSEARYLYVREIIHVNEDDKSILEETSLGEYGIFETVNFEGEEYDIVRRGNDGWIYLRSIHDTMVGKKEIKVKEKDITVNEIKVPLDLPMLDEELIITNGKKRLAIDSEDLEKLKSGKDIVGKSLEYTGQEEWISSKDNWEVEKSLEETEDKKKNPPLNKPKRGGSKKFYVYVKNPKTKKIKKVSFGDTTGLSAKINNPEARRAFAARHDCKNKKDKTKASYWSCNIGRYWKQLGGSKNFYGYW